VAVSGTYNFNLDIDEVIQEAMEMIGGEATSGHEPKSARRSINLMLKDWQNRGVLLWTTGTTTVTVAASTTAYTLSGDTSDVLQVIYDNSTSDIVLESISYEEYLQLPKKSQTGRATQYATKRDRDAVTVYAWPIAANSTDRLKIETIKELQDVDKSATQNADIHKRFLPALTMGLAYYMSLKRSGVPLEKSALLKAEYESTLQRSLEEDRQRTSMWVRPSGLGL
jgi:hypothetical protein